ncbi:MAG: dCTP deaminase [Oscillospiraceae bacterium]|jgi:dCTP deaminase|nr:dCTP deaminase [Oscillospiraceae bacterium]
MILSGLEILRQMELGSIEITPFDRSLINPNSCNLRLNNKLLIYQDDELDMKKAHRTEALTIPESGLMLEPGRLYLGRTYEYTRTDCFVPMLEGRSSLGRLGLYIHVTAGFGDVGFRGYWTLEMHCIHPIRIYPMVQICQIYYHTIKGEYEPYCSGKYQDNSDVQPSLLYKEF